MCASRVAHNQRTTFIKVVFVCAVYDDQRMTNDKPLPQLCWLLHLPSAEQIAHAQVCTG